MKTAIIASVAALTFAAVPGSIEHKFKEFMTTYAKSYTGAEREARFAIFRDNVAKIQQLNVENPSVVFDINQFSDMTMLERENIMHTGFRAQLPFGVDGAELVGSDFVDPARDGADFASCYAIVRDQGQCGSCWAFATTAAVQGAHCKANGFKGDLSPQALVDCDKKQSGCNGAYDLIEPFEHVRKNGLPFETDYQYTAKDGKCKEQEGLPKVFVSNVKDFSGKSADAIIEALEAHGPLSVGVAVSFQFQTYKGGVLNKQSCGKANLNHAVTLVGYERMENGEVAFKIRNSWGGRWGESGHIRMTWGACQLGAMVVAAEVTEAPSVLSRRF
eukprot:GDKH01010740.1.p1 GENE.GDKH01010740.1~~GDKH01010740.1.p1  ORF type:complete len:344 (-),score=70.40 GDKH01010740.1:207-1199(-)